MPIVDINQEDANRICLLVNQSIETTQDLTSLDLGEYTHLKNEIYQIINSNRAYLGQMDVNAKSPLVWDFYKDVLEKVN
ncbi:MAG: sucrose phosphorylase [Saprospiraceae bacterium]|jgi:sucrose phosphorylase